MSKTAPGIKLSDPHLFRTACYIDGKWLRASDGKEFAVDDLPRAKSLVEFRALEQRRQSGPSTPPMGRSPRGANGPPKNVL